MHKYNSKGFTLVEIMVVVAVIGLLASIAATSYIKSRTTTGKNACIANLKQIENAKTLWALDGNAGEPSLSALVPTYIQRTPTCPMGGTYTPGALGTAPVCSTAGDHVLS